MTAPTRIEHPTIADGRAHGKSLPTQAGLSSHTGWEPATDRADPVSLLAEQDHLTWAGAGACAIRRPHRDRGVSRQER